jgi:hypothetical protein
MTAPTIEVCPATLRRLAAGLSVTADRLVTAPTEYATAAPADSDCAGWAIAPALDGLVTAVEGGLRELAGAARELSAALVTAASAYEACDLRVTETWGARA